MGDGDLPDSWFYFLFGVCCGVVLFAVILVLSKGM